MEIEAAKQLLKRYMPGHSKFISDAEQAERYYRNQTDILKKGAVNRKESETPLRNADNRIPSNFHNLLVNQEAAYLFTDPPIFDIGKKGKDKSDDALMEILGDRFPKFCKDMCVNASNAAVAWSHVWTAPDGAVKYTAIDPKQIIPIWTDDLNRELQSVIRSYSMLQDDGKDYNIIEIWTDQECAAFRRHGNSRPQLEPYLGFHIPGTEEYTSICRHGFGFVPFVPFYNNNTGTNDLNNIKPLIDCYDKVFSGFLNDLEDIQEVIFVLRNYGGTDLDEFLDDLKDFKSVKVDADGDLSTLAIQIPVEAREKMLAMTRKAIFEQGMGIDPDPQNFGNSSGAALKYLYSLLELKAGLKETEFRLGFAGLIRQICALAGIEAGTIKQTWTRTSVSSDAELADIAQKSVGIISDQTILERHPWVEDVEEEKRRIEAQKKAAETVYPASAFSPGKSIGEANGADEQ